MINWYTLATDGATVKATGRSATLPAGASQLPDTVHPRALHNAMLDGNGGFVPRPLSPGITSAGTLHSIANIPAGTIISVFDIGGSETIDRFTVSQDGSTEVISLPDPGEYLISVLAPLPYLATNTQVTT